MKYISKLIKKLQTQLKQAGGGRIVITSKEIVSINLGPEHE